MSDDPKASLRKRAYAARKRAHAEAASVTPRATHHLLAQIGPAAGRIVAGYMPIRTEIDPIPAMTALHELGAQVCVPVIAGAGQPLDFRQWTPDVALVEGPFGAMVPADGPWLEPDTLIVPLVGYDTALNRLGYGGGFYDRTLERLRAKRATRAFGYAYGAQLLPSLPVEPTDQPLDAIVTPSGVRHRA